ncbi:MAG TPA: hypothetical protein VMN58_06780 [Acidimicrobiales bacterium]|nr:hypothetical protein [Acidimicrobiales bacterium]
MSLEQLLARTAQKIATQRTESESMVLEEFAIAARHLCPGAAAALVDWTGTEIARLRAFGIVHCALLRAAATRGQDLESLPAVPASAHAA